MKLNLKNITLLTILSAIVSGCGSFTDTVDETNAENTENSSVWKEEYVSATEDESVKTDLKPMVMIDDVIYVSTGKASDVEVRCGMMDGEIISEVSPDEEPKFNGQSNFGTGYSYQYVNDGIDLFMPEGSGENKWIRFEPLKIYDEFADYVGISAHVKEVYEDSLLISSDTDDFPGAFTVIRPTEKEIVDVKEGDNILILMWDMKEKDTNGLPKYFEENMVVLSEKEIFGEHDVLLTDAPMFELRDVLSSQLSSFKIKSENYSWNFKENGEIKSAEAKEDVYPEKMKMDSMTKLELPKYDKMESVIYSFSTVIPPDMLTVYQWDADDIDIKEQKVIKYYYQNPMLYLEPEKIYKFKAEWKKDNIGRNGFYGTANYVLMTE